jgi:Phage tail sheath protein subtilisin-like domain/Phage tail sheath C-terminal domain
MAFMLSPGVNVSEIDLTTIVPAVGTTEGAFAGAFNWGPMGSVVTISDEVELVNTFGKPDANTFKSFFSAANFLSYARNLKVVRAGSNTTSNNATSGSVAPIIRNRDDYEIQYLDLSAANTVGQFAARYPGDLGNSLKVSMWASQNATAYASWEYAQKFNSVPGTTAYASNVNGANDEMHIIVIDEDGKFTGVANTVLEKFSYVSKAFDASNDDGSSNYYVNVINDRSRYIYIMRHPDEPAANMNWGSTASNVTFKQIATSYTASLANGRYGLPTDADLFNAYDRFKNPEEIDVSLIITGAANNTVAEYVVDNIAGTRKDCVAFVSPLYADAVNNAGSEADDMITYRNLFNSSSYAVMDNNWKLQFDKYNNVYRWVPLNGDIAGLCVRTDFERDPWYSPAGFNRGQIKNVVKLAWNPDKTDRDELYKNGINPVVSFPGEGVVLYGDKTMLAKPSAFDRINVRRLFIVLEKAIARAAKYSLFEFNDEFTRAQFVALVEPFLRDVQGRRGIYDFRVVCDTTNNTPEVIDRNEFIGDIYIKPARSINFIQLNFVAVRTGVAFEEVVGKF